MLLNIFVTFTTIIITLSTIFIVNDIANFYNERKFNFLMLLIATIILNIIVIISGVKYILGV